MHPAQYLRRKDAANYLRDKYGHGSPKTLAKLACLGGGPIFRRFGRIVLYEPAELDAWAHARITAPLSSTSDAEPYSQKLSGTFRDAPQDNESAHREDDR